MHYLRWAKTHKRAKYELAISGVPPISYTEISAAPIPINIQVVGGYGDPVFIEHIAEYYHVPPRSVVPVPGTSSANFMAMAAVAMAGDVIAIEHPRYDPLVRAAEFLGLHIIDLHRSPREDGDALSSSVADVLRSGAKAVLLSNLHNPTGQYMSPTALSALAERCARFDAALIVDEVYLDAVSNLENSPRWTAASLAPNILATGSLTKVYGLGGLRSGWILAGDRYVETLHDIMDLLSVENPGAVASIANHVLSDLESYESRYRHIHERGRAIFQPWLQNERLLTGYANEGALFEWVRLPDSMSAQSFTERLADRYDTQLVSGHFFGDDNHVRISLTPDAETLAEGLIRVSKALHASPE